jgi:histidine triad (HIT) family protein
MIELPVRDPCDLCLAVSDERWKIIEESKLTVTVINPWQFENGVYSGQEVPHFHFHVVPRQKGSEWGIGPPQLATFDGAGRLRGTPHDPSGDAQRRERVQVSAEQLAETVNRIRSSLPE